MNVSASLFSIKHKLFSLYFFNSMQTFLGVLHYKMQSSF